MHNILEIFIVVILQFSDAISKQPFKLRFEIMSLISLMSERSPDFMSRQPNVNGRMRSILVDWLIEVHLEFKFREEVLSLSITILDHYLGRNIIERRELQLLGIVAMWIACKQEEVLCPLRSDFVHICDNAYSGDEMNRMELQVCNITSQPETRFSNKRKVGNGAYGTVYTTREKNNENRFVALKVYTHALDNTEGLAMDTLREINALACMSHRNVIHAWDVMIMDGKITLLLEGMQRSVKDHFRGIPQSLEQCLPIMHQIASGVEHCHARKFMHRDLKLQNVLINDRMEVKLCDFGQSRQITTTGRCYTTFIGTRWYRSPEQFLGDGVYNESCDMWSVGCMHVELRNSYPLFAGKDDKDQLRIILDRLGTPNIKRFSSWQEGFPQMTMLSTQLVDDESFDERRLIESLINYDSDARASATYLRENIERIVDNRGFERRRFSARLDRATHIQPVQKTIYTHLAYMYYKIEVSELERAFAYFLTDVLLFEVSLQIHNFSNEILAAACACVSTHSVSFQKWTRAYEVASGYPKTALQECYAFVQDARQRLNGVKITGMRKKYPNAIDVKLAPF